MSSSPTRIEEKRWTSTRGARRLLKAITKALVERMLEGELTHHLGDGKNGPVGYGSGNSRNGKSRKTLKNEQGQVELAVPRDRQGTFKPQLARKHQTRWGGLEEKIISLYAWGLTVRDIQAQLQDLCNRPATLSITHKSVRVQGDPP